MNQIQQDCWEEYAQKYIEKYKSFCSLSGYVFIKSICLHLEQGLANFL